MRAHFRMRTACAIRYGSGMTRTLPSHLGGRTRKQGRTTFPLGLVPKEMWSVPDFSPFLGVLLGGLFLRVDGLHRKPHASLVVGLEHLDLHDLAFLQVIGHGVDALVADLRNVQQAVASGQEL